MDNIILIGMPAVGKSTVGVIVAFITGLMLSQLLMMFFITRSWDGLKIRVSYISSLIL